MDSNKRATVDRRDFLKLAGVGLVGASSARLLLQPSEQAFAFAPNEDDVAILYDVSKCIGCRVC
jgi:hypothetical protein